MSTSNQNPLGRLRDIAASGRADRKPINLEPPSAPSGATSHEGELELSEESILAPESKESLQQDESHADGAAAATNASESTAEPVRAEPEAGNVADLLSGSIFPRLEIMLSQAEDYEAMNKGLRDGKLELGQIEGQPHVLLTSSGIDDLITRERDIVQDIEDQIVEAEKEIAEAEAKLNNARSRRTSLAGQTEATKARIIALQSAKSERR